MLHYPGYCDWSIRRGGQVARWMEWLQNAIIIYSIAQASIITTLMPCQEGRWRLQKSGEAKNEPLRKSARLRKIIAMLVLYCGGKWITYDDLDGKRCLLENPTLRATWAEWKSLRVEHGLLKRVGGGASMLPCSWWYLRTTVIGGGKWRSIGCPPGRAQDFGEGSVAILLGTLLVKYQQLAQKIHSLYCYQRTGNKLKGKDEKLQCWGTVWKDCHRGRRAISNNKKYILVAMHYFSK